MPAVPANPPGRMHPDAPAEPDPEPGRPGVVAGLAAGMGTVAATYGYLGSNADTSRWGAHAHIHSPLELMALLQLATSA